MPLADQPRTSLVSLRTALRLDAASSGAMGLLLLLAAGALAPLFDLPVALLRGAGLALLPFALALAWLSSQLRIPRGWAWAVIIANATWTLDSLLLPIVGRLSPSALGTAFVVAQALAVALFAGLQYAGLRALDGSAAIASPSALRG
ncbi:MAG: hypothetical protein ABIP93_02450 [Gemmatimonadaceae bacterium]